MTAHFHINVSSGLTLLIEDEDHARAEHARLVEIFGEHVTIAPCHAMHTRTRGNSRGGKHIVPPDPPPA
jgi:hypothetical protein